jgi:hypothetical protein
VRVLDLDWIYPSGNSDFCGGDALMRRGDLLRVDGFDDTLIAGEEPELCRRLRQLGRRILHIDAPMTEHDLAIRRFGAYWQRAFRAGHAYAEVAARFAGSADPLWQRESRRNLQLVAALPVAAIGAVALALAVPASLPLLIAVAVLLFLRSLHRCRAKADSRLTRSLYVLHSVFQQVPIACGQLAWHLNQQRGRRQRLIDYKAATP